MTIYMSDTILVKMEADLAKYSDVEETSAKCLKGTRELNSRGHIMSDKILCVPGKEIDKQVSDKTPCNTFHIF